MKKILIIVLAAVIALSLTGCGASANLTSNVNNNVTNVTLSQKNFHIVEQVSSSVSSRYYFGIGGLSKAALRNNAVAELTKKAQLQGSQALINVSVKESLEFYYIYWVYTCTAEATVIEFD